MKMQNRRSRNRALRSGVAALLAAWFAAAAPQAALASDATNGEGAGPPGILYRIADTEIHVFCLGSGSPAVLFEAGLAGNYLDWTFVQRLVAAHRRACAYDRPGAGWSARTARPRSADVMAEELHDVLRAAAIAPPVILVGHSLGGLLCQSYVAHYPDDVAGLVLVDSMHADEFARFAAAGVEIPTDPHMVLGRTPAAAAAYGLPADLQALARDLAVAAKARVFTMREMTAMPAIAAAVDADPPPPPRLVARVLQHGNGEWNGPYPDGRMERAWSAMQVDLARRFGAPPPTIVAESGHQIALDAPAAVASAIEAVAATLRP